MEFFQKLFKKKDWRIVYVHHHEFRWVMGEIGGRKRQANVQTYLYLHETECGKRKITQMNSGIHEPGHSRNAKENIKWYNETGFLWLNGRNFPEIDSWETAKHTEMVEHLTNQY